MAAFGHGGQADRFCGRRCSSGESPALIQHDEYSQHGWQHRCRWPHRAKMLAFALKKAATLAACCPADDKQGQLRTPSSADGDRNGQKLFPLDAASWPNPPARNADFGGSDAGWVLTPRRPEDLAETGQNRDSRRTSTVIVRPNTCMSNSENQVNSVAREGRVRGSADHLPPLKIWSWGQKSFTRLNTQHDF